MQHYSGKVQELPPFTTQLLSLFCLSLLFQSGNIWTVKCLKLLGTVFCSELDLLLYLLFAIFLPKCLKSSHGRKENGNSNNCFVPTRNTGVCSKLSRGSAEALQFRAAELSLVLIAVWWKLWPTILANETGILWLVYQRGKWRFESLTEVESKHLYFPQIRETLGRPAWFQIEFIISVLMTWIFQWQFQGIGQVIWENFHSSYWQWC